MNFRPRDLFYNDPGPRGSVFPTYEPVVSHGDPFRTRNRYFWTSQNANICYRRPKILILGLCMYCKHKNMYCRYEYMPQRYKLYVSKIQTICFKDANSILQIHNLYVVRIDSLCCKYTHCLCLSQRSLCITYTEYVFLCVTSTESVLSKCGATGCAPAGAFFPAKIHVLYFINIESVFVS